MASVKKCRFLTRLYNMQFFLFYRLRLNLDPRLLYSYIAYMYNYKEKSKSSSHKVAYKLECMLTKEFNLHMRS